MTPCTPEVTTALEYWLSAPRKDHTWYRLQRLVEHWCEQYGQSAAYTSAALAEAREAAHQRYPTLVCKD